MVDVYLVVLGVANALAVLRQEHEVVLASSNEFSDGLFVVVNPLLDILPISLHFVNFEVLSGMRVVA